MRKLIIFASLGYCLSISSLGAQKSSNWYSLEERQETINFSVLERNAQLTLEVDARNVEERIIQIQDPVLQDADVTLHCVPKLPTPEFRFDMTIELLHLPSGRLLGVQSIPANFDVTTEPFLIGFQDATELGLFLGEQYQLVIEIHLLGMVDCDSPRPEFAMPRQLPSVGLFTAGIIGLGIGEGIYGQQQRRDYQAYQDRWKNEELDDANLLDAAESARDNRRWLNVGGGLAMLAGGTWWLLERRKVKRRQRLYDEYCQPNLSSFRLRPTLIPNALAFTPGIQLTYQIR